MDLSHDSYGQESLGSDGLRYPVPQFIRSYHGLRYTYELGARHGGLNSIPDWRAGGSCLQWPRLPWDWGTGRLWLSPYTWAEKFESFERINSIRETNGNFDYATHVNGWFPAVYMSCMSQSFRLFHVSNLSVRNFRIFLLMYTGSLSPWVWRGGPRLRAESAPSPTDRVGAARTDLPCSTLPLWINAAIGWYRQPDGASPWVVLKTEQMGCPVGAGGTGVLTAHCTVQALGIDGAVARASAAGSWPRHPSFCRWPASRCVVGIGQVIMVLDLLAFFTLLDLLALLALKNKTFFFCHMISESLRFRPSTVGQIDRHLKSSKKRNILRPCWCLKYVIGTYICYSSPANPDCMQIKHGKLLH